MSGRDLFDYRRHFTSKRQGDVSPRAGGGGLSWQLIVGGVFVGAMLMLLVMLSVTAALGISALWTADEGAPVSQSVAPPASPVASSGVAPASEATTAELVGPDEGEVVWYSRLNPEHVALVESIEALGDEIEQQQERLDEQQLQIDADRRWLEDSARVISRWERRFARWEREYPDGAPQSVIDDARRLEARYEDAIAAHNARLAEASARLEAFNGAVERNSEAIDEYRRRWDRLARITASIQPMP